MKRALRVMKWFREVSVLAEDEQRRAGHPEIDAEHLFLALLGIGGPVTDELAARGVTLRIGRAAFERMHAARTAAMGIMMDDTQSPARRIPDAHARGGFVYRDGIRKLLEDASADPAPDEALLRALIDEPSGHVREALREFDIDPESIEVARDAPESSGSREESVSDYVRFVPADVATVWSLLSDHDRWLEWNGFEVEHAEQIGHGVVRTRVRSHRSDGAPLRVDPQYRVREHVISRFEPVELIQWERSSPDAKRARAQSLRVRLAPSGAGTQLTLSFLHVADSHGWARLSRWVMRPIGRYQVRGYLRMKADNISRALRQ